MRVSYLIALILFTLSIVTPHNGSELFFFMFSLMFAVLGTVNSFADTDQRKIKINSKFFLILG